MLIKIPKGWEIPEREVTLEDVYLNRRKFLTRATAAAAAGIGGLILPGAATLRGAREEYQPLNLPPLTAPRNPEYKVDRPLSSERAATGYNNYYEFTEAKDQVWKVAEPFKPRPWEIEFKGHVEKPRKIDVDELIKQMSLEERLYRHRCVERWVVIVPWVGFPMKKLVEWAKPTSQARYVRMVSFFRPAQAEGQRKGTWYPWPYYEGLTMAEATNELAFMVVGMYGKILPNQNGAPIRVHLPWKYGYKSIKAITKFEFVEKQPPTFWHDVVPAEYDFQANINPNKPHPRWSQATERIVEIGETVPTRLYNGYGKYVAQLYEP
ncbi:MAG: protein-methionine-sulfoxide reductase catalytic subunit MsrP [Acidobacteriia bacterium]|nr:protein-methionine-sulfoxide reductase catalytic subunit MsrP [Terriglobia bacterium]